MICQPEGKYERFCFNCDGRRSKRTRPIKMIIENKKYPYIRPCRRCDELFKPTGKYQRICDECNLVDERWKKKH